MVFEILLTELASLLDTGAVRAQADCDLYDRQGEIVAHKDEFLNQEQFRRATTQQDNLDHIRMISKRITN